MFPRFGVVSQKDSLRCLIIVPEKSRHWIHEVYGGHNFRITDIMLNPSLRRYLSFAAVQEICILQANGQHKGKRVQVLNPN